jgi:ribokinase
MPPAKVVKVAVVGHVEWVQFARVPQLPRAGEIVAAHELFHEPAGGGAVAAVQLARLAGSSLLITALGEDRIAEHATARLRELGVDVCASEQPRSTRHALTLVAEAALQPERTIVTFGERLQPAGEDRKLPWQRLEQMDAVYFTAGDLAALRHARAARVLVASPRAGDVLAHGIPLDALVLSGNDREELRSAARLQGSAALVVHTEGARGGTWWQGPSERLRNERAARASTDAGATDAAGAARPAGSSWAPVEPPGAVLDSYGCGDSFAAGLAYGLALDWSPARAVALAARCGATCLTGRGPYERQLSRAEIPS